MQPTALVHEAYVQLARRNGKGFVGRTHFLAAASIAKRRVLVEMRFFAGMTEAEIAAVSGISERWVRQQWAYARAWLRRELAASA